MAARWFESVCMGENGSGKLGSLTDGAEKDSNEGIDQSWRLESEDPDSRKLEVGSTARHVVGWRWACGVDIWRPVPSYLYWSAYMLPDCMIAISQMTYLPQNHPSAICTQHEHSRAVGSPRKSNAVRSFWERDHGLLITILPAVDMDHGFFSLRGEYMRCADRHAIGIRGAFLEAGDQGRLGLEVVKVYANVLGYSSLSRLLRR